MSQSLQDAPGESSHFLHPAPPLLPMRKGKSLWHTGMIDISLIPCNGILAPNNVSGGNEQTHVNFHVWHNTRGLEAILEAQLAADIPKVLP